MEKPTKSPPWSTLTLETLEFDEQFDPAVHGMPPIAYVSWQADLRLRLGETVMSEGGDREKEWAASEEMMRSGRLSGMCYDSRPLTNYELCVLRDWLLFSPNGIATNFCKHLTNWMEG